MTPEVAALAADHDLSLGESFLHTDLNVLGCECWPTRRLQPQYQVGFQPEAVAMASGMPDGGVCHVCGGLMVRTGTCTTCTSCGETGGCG